MKYVYMFSEGDASMRETLGGKGANLAEMTKLGLPVPQGFTVSTDACIDFLENNILSDKIILQIKKSIKKLEKASGKIFGGAKNPLILSVRSGARVSMPGMMDSVLNLGLNDEIVKEYATQTSPRFAYDCYRRFIQMYGNVVCQIEDRLFEDEIDTLKKQTGVKLDQDFTAKHLQILIKNFKRIFKVQTKKAFPQDVHEMLLECVRAVFRSWNNDRAVIYRKLNQIPDNWGTAVNVQMMVFGNLNEQSGTGVCFSRNPTNGENKFFGEFLMAAQGEDIVAGVRTPSPIEKLKEVNQTAYSELYTHAQKLEKVYGDMQDMEFTIENGKLYILQTRNAKRTTLASIRVAVDLVEENLIDKETAIKRIDANKIPELLSAKLEMPRGEKPIAKGIGASPGGAVGKIALSSDMAKKFVENGETAILVRLETSPEDISGMSICQGILTARGGTTSHAAVVARGMGTVCVSGCESLQISGKSIKLGGQKITVDALCDTGHTLCDPCNGNPVITVWYRAVENLWSKDELEVLACLELQGSTQCALRLGELTPGRFRLIPYRAVGVDCAMLLAFAADEVWIDHQNYGTMTIALSPTPVSDGGGYTALWGGERIGKTENVGADQEGYISDTTACGADFTG